MSRTSTLLLSDCSEFWNKTGDAVRADGWYGHADGLHTISIYVNRFIGRIFFEASIAEKPEESDWFPIQLDGFTDEFIEYPRVSANEPNGGETSVIGVNFTANVTWLRARMDRSYLRFTPQPQDFANYGKVSKILLSH